jgi:aspartyl-tRNA(Asn)/glutamyl-tRNA(Gln) amidotransferase subunit C
MTTDDIKALANLARIAVTEEEAAEYVKDFGSILGYVEQINSVDVSGVDDTSLQSNVARLDTDATPTGSNIDKLIAEAPENMDGFYKVQKIL